MVLSLTKDSLSSPSVFLCVCFSLSYFFSKLNRICHILFEPQKYLADILSVLALTMSAEGERVCKIHLITTYFLLPEVDITRYLHRFLAWYLSQKLAANNCCCKSYSGFTFVIIHVCELHIIYVLCKVLLFNNRMMLNRLVERSRGIRTLFTARVLDVFSFIFAILKFCLLVFLAMSLCFL